MSSNPWDKFFWNDWENDPALKLCSLAAQGLWMRILCICAKADPKGYLLVAGRPLSPADLSSLAGKPEPEVELLLTELSRHGVFPTDRIGRIYNRKMVRQVKKARTASENGKMGGNPSLLKQRAIPPLDKPPDKTLDKPHKPIANSHNQPNNGRDAPDGFDDWYAAYPRHESRGQAERAYRAATKLADAATLLAAAQRFRERRASEDPKFTPLPATWLNGKRWLDEPIQAIGGKPTAIEVTNLQGWDDRVRVFRDQGLWSAKFGQPPQSQGCAAPAEILEKYGYRQNRAA